MPRVLLLLLLLLCVTERGSTGGGDPCWVRHASHSHDEGEVCDVLAAGRDRRVVDGIDL